MANERLQRHIERLLDEADQAIIQRQWDVVREGAQDILAIDPESSDVRWVRVAPTTARCDVRK